MHLNRFLFITIAFISFGLNAQPEQSNDELPLNGLTHFEPIFAHKKSVLPEFYLHFKETSARALDSVFQLKKALYRINGKSDFQLTNDQKTDLFGLIKEAKKHGPGVAIGSDFKSIGQDIDSDYGIFFLINSKSAFTRRQQGIRAVSLEILVLNFKINEVIFYKGSDYLSTKYKGGYDKVITTLLNDLYRDVRRL